MAFELSHLDTSLGSLIRSGAAFLGIVLGSFILAAKPRRRLALLLGLLQVLSGFGYAVFTLAGGYDGDGFPHKELVVPAHLIFVPIPFIASGLLLAAFWPEIRQLPTQRIRFASALMATAVPVLLPVLALALGFRPSLKVYGSKLGVGLAAVDGIGYGVYVSTLTLVGAAMLAVVRSDRTDLRARALLLLGASGVANAVILVGNYVAAPADEPLSGLELVILLVAATATVQVSLAFLGLHSVGGWSRWVPIVLMLACLVTAPIEALVESNAVRDFGFGGIVTLASLLGIGYTVFRLDLLEAKVPRPRAGFYAALGLATLFATAQVAQNFLSDGLGLLWGGVVAGIVVFAAGPLQRRMERSASTPSTDRAARYRRMVETAWTDGRLGANERLLLAESRRQLGLDAETATSIDEDVARAQARRAKA